MNRSFMELNSKKGPDTYISPIRQRLIRALEISGSPQTSKALSMRLGISPSSVQHHLAQLLEDWGRSRAQILDYFTPTPSPASIPPPGSLPCWPTRRG